MALYELTSEQVETVLAIIDGAAIPGRAAEMVVSIKRALQSPVAVQAEPQQEPDTE